MLAAPPYPHLFSPRRVGPKEAKNRIWMTAHATLLVKDHLFTDAHIRYYVERAKAEVGVITMEAMAVHETTQPYKGKAFAFDERMVGEYRKIAAAVHAYDSLILAQPWHRGRQTSSVVSEAPVWAPSAVPCAVYREMPHVMTEADIAEIVQGYRLSARFARAGDLDGVEVHGMGHGYLLGQFLSPATNFREDRYGGALENRLRIVRAIIDATRDEVGPDRIVGVRINGDDGLEGGLGPAEWAEIAAALEATGKIDYVSVTQGTYVNRMLIYPTSPEVHGYQMPATRRIRQAIGLPVVGVGRITTPEEAEGFLADDACDFIGLSRALIADEQWGLKALAGRGGTIRPCVGANWCMESIFAGAPIACIHNPAAGREGEVGQDSLRPAEKPARVAVVGGGPGGMRAALTAARRGHEVTLFERGPALGGQVAWFTQAPSRRELKGIVDWLTARLGETEATIRLNMPVDADLIESQGFEAVVVATGATPLKHGWTPLRPASWDGRLVPGHETGRFLSYGEVFTSDEPMGPNVLLMDCMGGRQAVVTAEMLAHRGCKVEFATQLGQAAPNLAASRDWGKVYGMLKRMGVTFTTDVEIALIDGRSVVLRDVYTGERLRREGVDAVVMVNGARAEDSLYHALAPLAARGLRTFLIGDSLAPRRVSDAIREAELAARRI